MRSSETLTPARGRRSRMLRGRSAPTSRVCCSRGGRPSRSSVASAMRRSSFCSSSMRHLQRVSPEYRIKTESQTRSLSLTVRVIIGHQERLMSSTIAAPTQPSQKYPTLRNWIGGQATVSPGQSLEVINPSDGSLLSRVPLSGAAELDAAVSAARAALPGWSGTPIKERVQVFYRYRALLERHLMELAALISEEHGKVSSEAEAEVLKAIELTEFACSLPQIVSGEVLEVSRGIECRADHYPVGVVASIVPFNFPTMVPHWTIPNAIALGNCLILKPSELVPLSAGRIAELLAEAGLPAGVFSVVHGGREVVEAICDHPGITAVSFVGSTRVAQQVYRRGTANLKRVLALGGAKNHLLVLPDADLEMTSSNVVASMSGCTGQRCMAASVMVAVGSTDHIVRRLVEHARSVAPGKSLGP